MYPLSFFLFLFILLLFSFVIRSSLRAKINSLIRELTKYVTFLNQLDNTNIQHVFTHNKCRVFSCIETYLPEAGDLPSLK